MTQALGLRLRRLGYRRARRLVIVAGVALLALLAAVMYLRGVDTSEVIATLLFIPIFLAFFFYRVPGGLIAGIAAAIVYGALRYSAIEVVGIGQLAGLIASRTIAYLAFGVLGGWASRHLEDPLRKLELHDEIDDATGLYNARFFVENTALESARAQRYGTIFSVVLLQLERDEVEGPEGRHGRRALADLGRTIQARVRTVDRAVHADDGAYHLFAVVLPETGAEGARVFVDRLADSMAESLERNGRPVPSTDITRRIVTFPDDEQGLTSLRDRFQNIVTMDYPEAPRG